MSDLISRQAAVNAFNAFKNLSEYYDGKKCKNIPCETVQEYLKNASSLEGVTGIIRCKDCKWWNRIEKSHFGYCYAIKHCYISEHWDISILRRYKSDFYCADAEPRKEQEEEYEDEEP